MKISEEVDKLSQELDLFKKNIIAELDGIQDSKKIHRVSQTSFTIHFKDLSDTGILSPVYYDNVKQTKILKQMVLDAKSADAIQHVFSCIVNSGKYRCGNNGEVFFNDEVCNYIKEIL